MRPVAGVPIDLASVSAGSELIEDPRDPEPLPEDDDWVERAGLVPRGWITRRRVAKAIVGVGCHITQNGNETILSRPLMRWDDSYKGQLKIRLHRGSVRGHERR